MIEVSHFLMLMLSICLGRMDLASPPVAKALIDCNNVGYTSFPCLTANRTCPPDFWTCTNRTQGQCIALSKKCDSVIDCHDASDENPEMCGCPEGSFTCKNHACIPKLLKCDGVGDCLDNSDEMDCEYQCEGQYACAGTNKICIEKTPNACEMDEFQCANFRCVETVFYCDTDDDCGDMSDEPQGCVPRHTHCAESMIQCLNGSCLTREQLCKGFTCEEYVTDISGLTCAGVTCAEHQFQCLDGICIDESRVCNEIRDCFDGTDEDMSCNVDECQMFKPCSQICTDKKIGYECSCNQGDPPYLLVSNRYYIQKVNLVPNADDSHNITIIQSNLSHSVAIDFDISEQMIYWTDIRSQSSTISRKKLDGNVTAEVLHSSTVLNPDGIAVDWIGRNLYWCDRNTDTIEPRALELFPKYGYLFISDWGEHPHISRLSMDGTQKQHIITNDIAWPNGLTIDYITEKIFWVDANYDYIAMADLDGQNRHRISDQSLPHPFAITTFVDKIYWSDWEYNAIYEARKFSGEKRRRIALLNQRPMDVVVYHALRQPQWYNPCKQLNCSHLCLLKPDGKNNVTATSQFLCANSSKCIPGWWQCDGSPDCEDQSDERLKGDVCPPYTCKQPGLFQCTRAVNGSNECFSPNYICDGTPQCTDGSDEKIYDCANQECLPTQYKCTNSRNCIPYLWQCDGDNDCSEGDDELDCSTRKYKCIPKAWECDGEADCGPEDNTDENQCEKKTCEPNHFLCTNQHCIPQRWRCDDDNDCSDGSDEYNCTAKNCSDSEFLCPSGNRCIPNLAKCDGKADCSDGADESDDVCHATRPTCDPDQFICTTSRTCVPSSWRCDGERDCSDGSDEDKCHEHSVCKEWEYMCEADSKCIQLSWRCDGEPDCSDGKDEMDCVIESCAPNQYRCANKRKCIYRSQVCDMRPDCDGGDDEIKCFINDRDKCPDDHKCQGSCIVNKTEQRIVCTCPPAYRVASDGDLPKLLITAEENVYIQNPHSPQTRFKLSDDPTFKLGKIISLDVDATSENELLLLSLHRQDGDMEDPQAIAVDWLGKNLYWTDISKATISMLHYGDGSASAKKVTIIDKGLNRPFGIAVDPVIGKIFFTDYGNPPKVFSANLDGTDMKVIVEDKLISPRGIVVDYHSMRVYFADSKLRTVEAIRYGGEDRTLVRSFQKPYAPYHLDVFEDYVYATMFNRSLPVIKFSKFNGSTEALHNLSNSIDTGDIVIQHRNKQILPDNANVLLVLLATTVKMTCTNCEKQTCEGYCLNSGQCSLGEGQCRNPLVEGEKCNRSKCHDYCFNGGECEGCHLDPKLPAVAVCSQCKSQFGHSRLKDHTKMQVSNPIYMPQTTEEDDEDESHQPLDQPFDFDPEKSTNFANPVYEQFYDNSRQTLLPKNEDEDSDVEENKLNGQHSGLK
ncbi:LRP1-like protein [Mya arenaria]|uniref:LRP1-like protein n=1 Tax=Mya arenaria TaxID=6604 RepID=A0ABY7ENU8_MYAAR|nr:LRP1-like protein [Mya arenaria]